jgi:hypothetical protein
MKVKTALYVYHTQYAWQDEGDYQAYTWKSDDTATSTFVGQQEVELDIPDNYDPRQQQIAALVAQKQKIMADYQKTVSEINNRISNLQALEYTA